jgi:hypothetical protein
MAPGNGLAVNIRQAGSGALANAFAERGVDLFVTGENVHDGPIRHVADKARSEALESWRLIRYIVLRGHCFGAQSPGF